MMADHARIRVQDRDAGECEISLRVNGKHTTRRLARLHTREALRAMKQSLETSGCTVEFYGKHTPKYLP